MSDSRYLVRLERAFKSWKGQAIRRMLLGFGTGLACLCKLLKLDLNSERPILAVSRA